MSGVDDPREQVAAAARRLAAEGLLIGTAGNVSLRLEDRVYATASGVVLGACTADDVVGTTMDGTQTSGSLRPTSELGLHLGVYAARDCAAIVHTHAPFATTIACAVDRFPVMPVLHYQQLALGGDVRVAPYATFGSPELASSAVAALEGREAALLAKHGAVTVGASLDKAVDHALLLEWLAALLHRTAAVTTPEPLTEAEQGSVIEQVIALSYGAPTARPDQEEEPT